MAIFGRKPKPPKTPVWTPEGDFKLPHYDGTYDQPKVTIHAPTADEVIQKRAATEADAEQLRAQVAKQIGDTAVQSQEQQ